MSLSDIRNRFPVGARVFLADPSSAVSGVVVGWTTDGRARVKWDGRVEWCHDADDLQHAGVDSDPCNYPDRRKCLCGFDAPDPVTELATNAADIRLVLVAAIVDDEPLAVVHYNHTTRRTTLRYVIPRAIERCKNGSTIVRVYDLQNKAPRLFRLENIRNAGPAF